MHFPDLYIGKMRGDVGRSVMVTAKDGWYVPHETSFLSKPNKWKCCIFQRFICMTGK